MNELQHGIFVPTIMAGGLVFSFIVLLRDAFDRLVGDRIVQRIADETGHATAGLVAAESNHVEVPAARFWSRTVYTIAALVFLGLAVYVVPGATFNYLRPDGYLSDIAWIWAISMLSALLFAVLGAALAFVAIRYDRLSTLAAATLVRTPLSNHTTPRHSYLAVDRRRARPLRLLALAWSTAVCATLAGLAVTGRIPHSPEGGILGRAIERPLQLFLVALLALAAFMGGRRPRFAAVVTAAGASLLGVLAAYEYPPLYGVALTAGFAVPGIVWWLIWRHRQTWQSLVVLAVGTMLLLVTVAGGASALYDRYYGPTTPESSTPRLAVDRVRWAWVGGVTQTSASARAQLTADATTVRLAVATDPQLHDARYGDAVPTRDRIAAVAIEGLTADTEYFYSFEVDGRLDEHYRGRFRTFPTGPASFRFAFASCARTASNSAVFDAIRQANPLVYLSLGDFFYANIDRNELGRFHDAYAATLRSPAQAALYRDVPIAYVWDDHDYGGNDANSTSPSRTAAMAAYRQLVPHYPLATDTSPIYQAFTVGRVRFLVTDTRSARDPASRTDDASKTMLGAEQLAWFERELRDADRYGLVVWVNPNPWIATPSAGGDTWSGYTTERHRLANLVSDIGVRNLVMISGDAHAGAADDGTNSDYSDRRDAGFPVLHAAPLDRPASVKGGPYSEGVSVKSGQFGLVDVRDDGQRIRVEFTLLDYTGAERLAYDFDVAGT